MSEVSERFLSPTRRAAACVCGSGRRAAECCLPWEEAFGRLVSRMAAFSASPGASRLESRAARLFWGAEASEGLPRVREAGTDACFREWFLQDYVAPGRTGPLLAEWADGMVDLGPREEQLLLAMLRTPVRPFEIVEAPGPRGFPVKDLLDGAEGVVGPCGLPEGVIRSDVGIGRLLPVGRLWRLELGVLRIPPGAGGELLAYLRTAYRLSRPGRHVSLEDFADGAAHLYHQFFLERGREMGGRAHRTARWIPWQSGKRRYVGSDTARIQAVLERQSSLERCSVSASEVGYAWTESPSGISLGSVVLRGEELLATAETEQDLRRLGEVLEDSLRGYVRRDETASSDDPPPPPASPPPPSGVAGQACLRRIVERWPELPHPLLSDEAPREACRSLTGREQVGRLLLQLERDLARQKRLGRAWAEIGPLWERLDAVRPLPRGAPEPERGAAGGTAGRKMAR
jgi:hypothetical protein